MTWPHVPKQNDPTIVQSSKLCRRTPGRKGGPSIKLVFFFLKKTIDFRILN